MSEKAMSKSNEKLVHLASKCITKETLDAIEAESLEDYGSKLNKTLKGKVLRLKFIGEEIEGKEGKKAKRKREGAEKAQERAVKFNKKSDK